MRPTFLTFNSAYLALLNAIFGSNFFLQSLVQKNSFYLGLSKFCGGTSFSAIRCSMQNSISLIICRGVPTQIFKNIILGIAIIVTTFLSGFRVAFKCPQNKSANATKFVFIFPPKKYRWTPIFFINCRFFEFASFYVTNSTLIRYFIAIFKSRNRHPNFYSHGNIPVTLDMGIVA